MAKNGDGKEPKLISASGRALNPRPSAPPLSEIQADELYPVPREMRFITQDDGREWPFIEAPDVEAIAEALIEEHAVLKVASGWRIAYLWRANGGVTGGKATLGKTKKLTGELGFYVPAEFLIWIAADHCLDSMFTYSQIQALIFHELLHVSTTDNGSPTIMPHDAEIFREELEAFGTWNLGLRRTFDALDLPLFRLLRDDQDE